MQHVIIVIHLMVVTALVVLVLYQKSEGGALGMGQSGLFTGRGQANALTRATGILATIFFLTSIALTVLPAWERGTKGGDDWTKAVDQPKVEFKEIPSPSAPTPAAGAAKDKPAGDAKESIFDQLKRAQETREGAASPPADASAPVTPPVEAPKAAAPADEPEKPALRPTTQDAPASAAPAEPVKPEAEIKAPSTNLAPGPAGDEAPKPAADAPAIWKTPPR
jgi:protein translocase SecG subunit